MDHNENEENDNKFPHGLCSNLLPQFDLEDNVHPFTHLQQVQLRAQILVYGSLIRDTLPDEPYMVLAFGEFGFVEGVRGRLCGLLLNKGLLFKVIHFQHLSELVVLVLIHR